MTGPDESQAATRPISVAELLAKNGTLGAPPVTGRRRRRRGNTDAVTVAELTGEIPVIQFDEDSEDEATEFALEQAHTPLELSEVPVARRGRDGRPELGHDPRPHRAATDVQETDTADVEVPDLEVSSDPETSDRESPVAGAELMSPDPIDVDDLSSVVESGQPDALGLADGSYSSTADSALFGGDSLADELSRAGTVSRTETYDGSADLEAADAVTVHGGEGDADEDEYLEAGYYDDEQSSRGRAILRGLMTAVQSVFAVAFGAGMFIAFEQLWRWNSLVAMVLAVLVTLGLVAGVWVVRKTEDITSTLIAVGVGLLVTFGPLALMHAG